MKVWARSPQRVSSLFLFITFGYLLHFLHLVCCIYHKPKRFDESSSSDNSSGSDSDSSCDHSHPHSHGRRKRRHVPKPDSDSNLNGESTRNGDAGESVVHELNSDPDEPNMYEKVPRKKKGKGVIRSEGSSSYSLAMGIF